MTEIVTKPPTPKTDVVEYSFVEQLFQHADAYTNDLIGMGGKRDASVYTRAQPRGIGLPDPALTALYAEDPEAARIVDFVVDRALRAGWDIETDAKPETAAQQRTLYTAEECRLRAAWHLDRGARWGRQWGGAVTWMGVDDGEGTAADEWLARQRTPLDLTKVRRVLFLRTYDRRVVVHETTYQDPMSPKHMQTATYRITPRTRGRPYEDGPVEALAGGVEVHESRLLVWPGAITDERRVIDRSGWDDSVLERAWEALRASAEDYGSKGMVLNRIAQMVAKIKNLGTLIASGERKIRKRMDLLVGQWTQGKIAVIDTEEDVQQLNQPISGLGDVLDRDLERTARAGGIAPTVFAGKGVTEIDQGASDEDVVGWRDTVFVERHRRLAEVIIASSDGPLKSDAPSNWRIVYRPMHTPPPLVRAQLRKLQADTDAVEVDKGIIPPEAVALQRHTMLAGGATEIMLDQAEVSAALKRREDLARKPPKDNAELGTVGARDSALGELQKAFFNGEIPLDAALARLELVFQFAPPDAQRLLKMPTGWKPTQPEAKPGPAPDPAKGEGAGAPQGLPGFNDGGAPNDKTLPPKASGANE